MTGPVLQVLAVTAGLLCRIAHNTHEIWRMYSRMIRGDAAADRSIHARRTLSGVSSDSAPMVSRGMYAASNGRQRLQ